MHSDEAVHAMLVKCLVSGRNPIHASCYDQKWCVEDVRVAALNAKQAVQHDASAHNPSRRLLLRPG